MGVSGDPTSGDPSPHKGASKTPEGVDAHAHARHDAGLKPMNCPAHCLIAQHLNVRLARACVHEYAGVILPFAHPQVQTCLR